MCNKGAQAKRLEELKPELWVYSRVQHKDYRYINGEMSCGDRIGFLSVNRHTYEIITTDRKQKFCLEYDQYVDTTDQSAEVHDAALADL